MRDREPARIDAQLGARVRERRAEQLVPVVKQASPLDDPRTQTILAQLACVWLRISATLRLRVICRLVEHSPLTDQHCL